jgi:hypothetical protein
MTKIRKKDELILKEEKAELILREKKTEPNPGEIGV